MHSDERSLIHLTAKLCYINCTKPVDDILEKSVAKGLHFMLKNTRSSRDVILLYVIHVNNVLVNGTSSAFKCIII